MTPQTAATLADLYAITDKAELVNGELVRISATGGEREYAGMLQYFTDLRKREEHLT